MKKLIAIGITTIGSLGLLGLGSGIASAATPTTAKAQVCSSATAQLANQAPALAAATSTESNTHNALTAANTGVTNAESGYIASAMLVVSDVDNSVSSQQQQADTITFNNAVTTFVNSVVTQSTASVNEFNAAKSLAQLALQSDVLATLKTDSCPPVG